MTRPLITSDTGKIDDITLEISRCNPSVFQFFIGGADKDNALIAPGNDVEIYISLNGHEAKLGSYTIDAVTTERSELGSYRNVAGRGAGGKKLAQWMSDAYYDIWSQTKQSCNPSNLAEMIRLQGLFKEVTAEGQPTYLTLTDLNKEGAMYTAMKSSRGCITRARAMVDTSPAYYEPEFALYVNLYQYKDDTKEGSMVFSGIKGKVTHTNWYIYYVIESTERDCIASGSWTMPDEQLFWIELQYFDGVITFKRRLDTETSWTTFGTAYYFTIPNTSPYGTVSMDNMGRPGMSMKNITPHSNTPGFASNDMVVPLEDITGFPTSCTLSVDSELITVNGKSTETVFEAAHNREVDEGITFMNAPHDNAYWVNGVIMSIPIGDPEADQAICAGTTTKYLSWCFYHTGTITIDKIQLRIKKVGNPTTPVYVYLVTDDWDNGNSPDMGAVLTYGSLGYTWFTGTYNWYEFTFATPQTLPPPDHGGYWLVLTNVAPGQTPTVDASNYYQVSINESTQFIEGYFFLWDGGNPHWLVRNPIGKPTFKLIGEGNDGDGYEIYCHGPGGAQPRDFFDGSAVVVTDGAGKGSVFKIQDYDYQAPDQWVPSRFYNPPDRWQDHVGDPAHGSWVTPQLQRLFVDQDPSGTVAKGSKISIYPAMQVTARGASETIATSHSAGMVSYYSANSVKCDKFEYFSGEMDQRLEDVVYEITRKAGVIKPFSAQKIASGTYTKSTAGWETLVSPVDHRNPIIRHTIPASGNAVYTYFHYTNDGGSYINGKYFAIYNSTISLYGADNTLLMTWTSSSQPANDWVTISIQEDNYCVWFKDRLVAAYHDDAPPSGGYNFIAADNPVTFNLDWSACDRRVDNFALDAGTRGDQLISQLINKKRFYWLDTQDGGIKLFHTNDTIPGTYSLAAVGGTGANEQDLVTRIRVMGLYEYETFNPANMQAYGNLYSEAQIEDADTLSESIDEANKILDDFSNQYGRHQLVGAADPRIEPLDVITYNTGAGAMTMKVDSVSINISMQAETPSFDMKLEGFDG